MNITNLYIGYNEIEDFRVLICANDDIEALDIANEYLEDTSMSGTFKIEQEDSNRLNLMHFDCDHILIGNGKKEVKSDFYLRDENCYQRLEDEFKKYGKLIFCVDFDDTIYDFHKLGRKYDDVINLLHRWENYSEVVILTGNGEDKYPMIQQYLNDNNIKYKGINCDSSVYVQGRKTYANVYIDDRGGLPCVYRMLDKLITRIENGLIKPDIR